MATEYSITYTFTGRENCSSENYPMIVEKGKFEVSGDTDKHIGKITRIVYEHYHTSTGTGANWNTLGRLHFADGSYIDSEEQSQSFSGNVKKYTQEFPVLPTAAQFATWSKIETVRLNNSTTKILYWRAVEGNPITLTVYFEASPPVYRCVNGVWVEQNVEGIYVCKNGVWLPVDEIVKV